MIFDWTVSAPKPVSEILIAPLSGPSEFGVRMTATAHEPPGGTAYPSMHVPKVMPNWGFVDSTLFGTNEPGPALYIRTNHSAPARPTIPVPTLMSAIDSCGCWVMPTTWRVEFGCGYRKRVVRRAGERVEDDDTSGR